MPRFDLNLLASLNALLQEQSVTRAAERLHVTQPTMSGMLQRLRFQFSDPILTRVGRNMALTPLAQSLVKPVHDALQGIEALVYVEPSFDPTDSVRTFTIMVSDYCALTFLPRIVCHLAIAAPSIRLEILPLNTPLHHLNAGDIDICIATDDWNFFDTDDGAELIQSETLFCDELICIAAKDHPISNRVTMEEYLSYPHIGVKLDDCVKTIEATAIQRHIPTYKPAYIVSDFTLVPHIVAESNIIGLVQKRLATLSAETLSLRTFTPPFSVSNINEIMIWHPRNTTDLAHQWLRDVILQQAKEYSVPQKATPRPFSHSEQSMRLHVIAS